MENRSTLVPIILTVILVSALCCLAICLVLFVGSMAYIAQQDQADPDNTFVFPIEPEILRLTPGASIDEPSTPLPTFAPDIIPISDGALETLRTLQEEIVPINNALDLAERLGGKRNIPETLPDSDAPYAVGATKKFWVTNVDTNENFMITAVLRYLGKNVYIWIESGVNYNPNDLTELGDAFDNQIYPNNREFFGSEWSPGVDDDAHIYIVYAGGLGRSLAGYYSSADQLHPDAHEYSNAHEMFLINSDNVYLWEDYIYGTLAHEFQHMIHWYTDMNEETWLNEGFSMLAELINGYDPGGFEYSYIWNTDLQLTDWGSEVGENGPHYGAAFLFTTYFLDRFGEDVTKAVVAHDENGMESIDTVLEEMDIRDPQTGLVVNSEDIFADWTITNFLGDPSAGDGRYFYSLYPTAPLASPTTTYTTCPSGPDVFDVHQFGVDYVELTCPGNYNLQFRGAISAGILPTQPFSGDYFFWSNMGDHSNMSLEREFDLTEIEGLVEMTYQTWYDLETDYDYVFISASTDGETWQLLESTSCTRENPSGNSYGCGLNGQSAGWQEEAVDLSRFAGQKVTVRFDYVTDAAVNGVGMVIDDIRVNALDYFTDLESDEGGWKTEGFVRIQNFLPQTFRLSLISYGPEITIQHVEMDENNIADIDIEIGDLVDSVVIVISGTTPVTRQKAEYQIEIGRK